MDRFDDDASDNEEQEADRDIAAFEREYEEDHSWEELEEDEYGNLRPLDRIHEQRARRQQLLSAAASARIRRGMIRYVQLVLDLSRAAAATDMRPTRVAVLSGVAQQFIRTFFDENPLSQLGIILLRNGVAEQLTELSSSPEAHITRLRSNLETGGDASLQNALDLSVATMRGIPPYGHREVLMLYAALSTCDPGNILDSIKGAKQQRVRVSIIGLSAEVHICKVIAQDTGGTYGVALSEAHLEQLVLSHAVPPPAAPGSAGVSLVKMGFPAKNSEAPGTAAFLGPDCELRAGGFTCPRCKSRTAELPSRCHVCGLTLVSSPHLARSYHHLFPVKPFQEVGLEELQGIEGCGGLQPDLPPAGADAPLAPYCYGCCQPVGQAPGVDQGAGIVFFMTPCAVSSKAQGTACMPH
ncbi:hypothetical protein N2152v2_009322 [Parachlorella kessleri]